jgi:hypoxanthine-DNA glycosylase
VFWPITGALFDVDVRAPYETRLAALQSHGVALWDVLHKCRRTDSSDATIDPEGLVSNDFGRLFATYSDIVRVYFNGHTADQLFRRLVHLDAPVSYQLLPSTSPARAMPAGRKLDAWRGDRLVMTPAVAGAPTAWLTQSEQPAAAASPRRTGGRPVEWTAERRCGRVPTGPRRRAAR